jgi:2-dehydropantoate 2-reductase
MAHVAIVGVGAIGGALAALLETAGDHEITLCTRRPLTALTVKTPEGAVRVKARNLTDPALAEAVDWVLVATKAYSTEGAAAWLAKLSQGKAPVAVVQNGVEHRERFAPYVRQELIVPVVIDCPVERWEDGTVHRRGTARMRVEAGEWAEGFAGLFAGSAAQIELTEDFKTAAWKKLCVNAPGAISALVMRPSDALRDEALGRLALGMVAECVAVGRAEGATLDDSMAERVLNGYRAQPADSINSMHADRIAGRPMEIDARNGVIVRKGEKHGIPTPLNRMAVALLQAMAAKPL